MGWLFNRQCEAGWGYNAKTGSFVPNSNTSHSTRIKTYGSSTTKFGLDHHMNCFHHILNDGMPRSFIEAIINKNETVNEIMDFLINNHGIKGYISNVYYFGNNETPLGEIGDFPPEITHYVSEVYRGSQILVIFNNANLDLFYDDGTGEFLDSIWQKKSRLTEKQKSVVCHTFELFSGRILNLTIGEIIKNLDDRPITTWPRTDNFLKYKLTKIDNNSGIQNLCQHDSRFRFLANQIFQIYWKYKKNRLLSNYEKLMKEEIDKCREILGGAQIHESQLRAQMPLEEEYEIKNLIK